MPQRQTTVKIPADKVQGDGAWIEWKRLTWGERRDLLREYAETPEAERGEWSRQYLYAHLAGWNWVDNSGEPLPLPSSRKDEEAMFEGEIDFLYQVASDALLGKLELTEERLKN